MNQIPSMWRTELWHPLLIHFPIVTLLLASIAGSLLFVKNNQQRPFLRQFFSVVLWIGVITAWISIYTGQLAYNIEVRKICDPPILQQHQWWSYATSIIYSVVLLLHIIVHQPIPGVVKRTFYILIPLFLLVGSAGLFYAGHLGASVVYQQGAGTYKPSENCNEFVR